ncbi:HD domain-containing protein [Patescibacteria group bacterium]|nr:HD domain-containing protein [Patescibacteria group bacterium]MBU1673461.1 HD domain-containing protein [Patescibacteria group bacterium]MBU1962917.1 HD domain-containing protein [Patescibacteria group bacterium]
MIYKDKIYGQFEITEPVILDLLKSRPLERLKDVNQYGASMYRFSHLTTTRFEHSVGAYHILNRFNATLEEQVAGLLHDVPHTAFSHVIDFVFGGESGTPFHEEFHEQIINNSDIPAILKKHGINKDNIFDESKFKLLERSLPDICADRIDYFFRDMVTDKVMFKVEVDKYFSDMVRWEGDIAFEHEAIAREFAERFREGSERLWGNPLQAALYHIFAEALKIGLMENIITFRDLFTTDDKVYEKLLASDNKEISKRLEQVKTLKIEEDSKNYDFYVKSKIRVINPYILKDDKLVRLSVLDPAFHRQNQAYYDTKREGFYIKIV